MISTRTKTLGCVPSAGTTGAIALPACTVLGGIIYLDWVGGTVAATDKAVAEIRTVNDPGMINVGGVDSNSLLMGATNQANGSVQGAGVLVPMRIEVSFPISIYLYLNAQAGTVGTWYATYILFIDFP